jgi:hypothetical protein
VLIDLEERLGFLECTDGLRKGIEEIIAYADDEMKEKLIGLLQLL